MLKLMSKDLRLELLIRAVRWIYPGYRLTWPYLDWWHDAWFTSYLARFDERSGLNTHRRWQLWQLTQLAEHVPGDTAECGAYRGASSYLICEATKRQARQSRWHHIFDSFEGLSAPVDNDGSYWSRGDLSSAQEELENNLREYDRFSIHPGWIPERFPEVEGKAFSLVHIDVDLYEPTRDSLEFFYPRLSEGGLIICDDYACSTCPGATRAVEEFLADKPESMISLAAGGGFLIKGTDAHLAR